jgi:twitching motility protein PilT
MNIWEDYMGADIIKYLQTAVEKGASDIFIISGLPVSLKRNGVIVSENDEIVMPQLGNQLVTSLYELASRDMGEYLKTGDDDFSVSVKGLSRFRVSTYMQRGSMAAVIRVVNFEIPDYRDLMIPDEVMNLSHTAKGMILVTGPAGGGKSTTLALMTNAINQTRNAHIITIEDPIEYLHKNIKSVVSQREIGTDTASYVAALRACLRQAPDVIVVGEMRDLETIRIAMTAAETGHLVISTLHTIGAANTIDRIIDVFPPNQQQQIRIQLAMVLRSVVSQQLLPRESGGLIPVFEIMHLNNAIRNMIRESKIHQIDSVIQSASSEGMVSMDTSLLRLYEAGEISVKTPSSTRSIPSAYSAG